MLSQIIKQALNAALPGGNNGKLSVITFHKVPTIRDSLVPDDLDLHGFESIINFLQIHTNVLCLSDALEKLNCGTLPPRSVAITFDDGYAEWCVDVSSALIKRSMPATFFVSTEILNGIPNWHERIVEAVRVLPSKGAKLPTSFQGNNEIDTIEARILLINQLQGHLKYAHLDDRLKAIESLEGQAASPIQKIKAFKPQDVKFLHDHGFSIGAHTIRHPILTQCTDDEARTEISKCKYELEDLIGTKVKYFAYPNGRPQLDFSEKHVEMVIQAGYEAAFTTLAGVATKASKVFQLPRSAPWPSSDIKMAVQFIRNSMGK